MTPEELLLKRVIITSPWPGMPSKLNVGSIYTWDEFKKCYIIHFKDTGNLWLHQKDVDECKCNLRQLNWWEERDIEDMPEYVKCTQTPDNIHLAGLTYKVRWITPSWGFEENESHVIISTNCYIHATITDYQNQSK